MEEKNPTLLDRLEDEREELKDSSRIYGQPSALDPIKAQRIANTMYQAAARITELEALVAEGDALIRELLQSTGFDKPDRKALQNEYIAGGKFAGTVLSCLNHLAKRAAALSTKLEAQG